MGPPQRGGGGLSMIGIPESRKSETDRALYGLVVAAVIDLARAHLPSARARALDRAAVLAAGNDQPGTVLVEVRVTRPGTTTPPLQIRLGPESIRDMKWDVFDHTAQSIRSYLLGNL